MSFEWWRDLHAVAKSKVNAGLHVDVSGWQERCKDDPEEFATAVRHLMDAVGSDRMHFGTDDPAFYPVHPKDEWIDNVRALAERESDPTFTEREVERLLGENSAELFDL
jgi:predicted TIM-barrel fold metal-dependent hydrolase